MDSYPLKPSRIAVVILIDQSGSMAEMHALTDMLKSKAELATTGVNTLLTELLRHAQGPDGQIYDIFDVALIGYGGDKATYLLHKGLFTARQLDRTRSEYIIDRPCHNFPTSLSPNRLVGYRRWLAPTAHGRTPMGGAIKKVIGLLQRWCEQHTAGLAPLVINISDGEASDISAEQLTALAEQLKSIGTEQGGTLLMNIHIDSLALSTPLKFPAQGEPLPPHRHTRLLYDISGTLPKAWEPAIAELKGPEHQPPYKALCYNCAAEEIFSIMRLYGTAPQRDEIL